MDRLSPSSLEEVNQLGAPLAIRHARTFHLLIELLLGGLWFLLCLAPVLFAVAMVVASAVKGDAGGLGGGLLILGFFGSLAYVGGKITLRAWRGLGVRLLVFPEGIVYTRRRLVVAYRWEDILAFSHWGIDHMNLGVYLDSLYRYRFRHRDGHQFIFAESLNRHEEKPIADFVEDGLLDCQLPHLRKRFLRRNEEICFGPFILDPEGLAYKRAMLPWPDVDFIWAEEGRVRVRKKDKILNWCSVKMDKVPNCCLLLALAKERLSQEESRE